MTLSETSTEVLYQLADVIGQMNDADYSRPLPLLSGNSIGKHVRHIAELYLELLRGNQSGQVSYDKRQRNIMMEQHVTAASDCLQNIISEISNAGDKVLRLEVNYRTGTDADQGLSLFTSFNRELAYNIEHCIHHMAIIAIALRHEFAGVRMHKDFGIAPSTVRYQQQCAQ